MEKPRIKVVIRKDGSVEVQPSGYGAACKDATRFLQSLGSVEKERINAEFFEKDRNVHVKGANQG